MKYSDAYNQTLQAYGKQGKKYLEKIERFVLAELYDFLNLLPPGGRILDVGCAGGRDCKKFVEHGFEAIGIDVVEEFLDEAKRNVPKAKFFNMNLLKLDFPNDYFDGIWSAAVLLHIQKKDLPKVLQNYHDLLKPAGKLFIGLKSGEGMEFVTDKLSGEKRLFVYYEKDEIIEVLEKNKFKILKSIIIADEADRKDTFWIRIIAEKI
jgi:SAM-dependent methyltransferase